MDDDRLDAGRIGADWMNDDVAHRPGHARDRTHYQAGVARMRDQIVTLLDYPQVGPLDANAIAINLGTMKETIERLLAELVATGNVRQVDNDRDRDRYVGGRVFGG